ncbi:major capsid protein [Halomicroarcula sp. GCM10025709]|uniref:major capsid protein n=1 Tax=Haloarcula TaxID=2237 RepID=UPI0024C308DC|nr:major capsid protein [Halomicroarcula sp. YJ-61-S]
MSANSITANVGTVDDIGLPADRVFALTANDEQSQRLQTIRANAVQEAKKNFGPGVAKWVANSFTTLDQAVVRGYRMSGRGPTGTQTANNQILDFDEHEDRAEDVLQEVRTNLTMMESVMAAGFTRDTSLARTEYIKQRSSKWSNTGEISMDGRAESTPDERNKERFGVPIPIVHVDYDIPARKQQQSMNFGESIEDEQAEEAGRILRETEENLFRGGWGPTVPDSQGNSLDLYGITDSAVSITGSASGDWGTASNIKDTIDAILNELETQTADNDRGPDPVQQGAWLWYHPNQRSDLRAADPDGDGNMTVMTRLQQDYPYLDMQAAGELQDGEVVCLVKDPRFVRILTAQAPTNLSEEVDMGLATEYKTLASRIPFFQTTYDGVKGAVYYTGA